MTTFHRRSLLKAGLGLGLGLGAGALAAPWIAGPARAANKIRLGSLLDTSGIFDLYGKPMDMAVRLGIDQINKAGGLNGREVEIVSYDTQSDMALYPQYVQQLVRTDKVDVVVGGILSASREAIRPILHRAKVPYFFSTLYEGGVCDRNIMMTGITPAQELEVLVPEAIKKWGKKVYIIAADYNYGQITARWMQKYAKDAGADVLSVDFFPLDVTDFGSTIAKIQSASPTLILSALVGGNHLAFYRQWTASGMKSKIPIASATLGSANEHKILTAEESNGILVAYNYSLELQNAANKAFLAAWAAKYGDTGMVHELAVSHYQAVMLWAAAVRKAGGVERDPMVKALEDNLSIDGPGGKLTVDPKTHHLILDIHLMEIMGQKMTIVRDFAQRPPVDTQQVCDLVARPNDTKQYEIKIN